MMHVYQLKNAFALKQSVFYDNASFSLKLIFILIDLQKANNK